MTLCILAELSLEKKRQMAIHFNTISSFEMNQTTLKVSIYLKMSGNNQEADYKDPLEGQDVQVQLGGKKVPLNSINKPHGLNPAHQPGNRVGAHSHGSGSQQNPLIMNSGHRPSSK